MYFLKVGNSQIFIECNLLLRDVLHWLPVPLRVEFKICLLVYKLLHGATCATTVRRCIHQLLGWDFNRRINAIFT